MINLLETTDHRYSSDYKNDKNVLLRLAFVIYWIYDVHEDKNNKRIEKQMLSK